MTREEDAARYVRAVYGGCEGYVEVSWMDRSGAGGPRLRPAHVTVAEALAGAENLVSLAESGRDVYLGCCTLESAPERGRGKADSRNFVPGVWIDMDLEVAGHHAPREDGLRRIADLDEARQILVASDLPAPSMVIHSGGGLYSWWLFTEPICLEDELDRAAARALLEAVNQRLSRCAAEAFGVGVDRLGDLARVLRPPGTFNWKRGANAPPEVKILKLSEAERLAPALLAEHVEEELVRRSVSARSPEPLGGRGRGSGGTVSAGLRPSEGGDLPDAARCASWAQILEPVGWVFESEDEAEQVWCRPGKDGDGVSGLSGGSKPGDSEIGSSGASRRSAVVFKDLPEVIVVFSDAAGLPQGEGRGLTKFRVMSHLWFGGNLAACARDLSNAGAAHGAGALRAGDSVWPECVLEEAAAAVGGGLSGRWAAAGPWRVVGVDGRARSLGALR